MGEEDQLAACLGETTAADESITSGTTSGGPQAEDHRGVTATSWGLAGGGGGWGRAAAEVSQAERPPGASGLHLPHGVVDPLAMRPPAVLPEAPSTSGIASGAGMGRPVPTLPTPWEGVADGIMTGPTIMFMRPPGAPVYQMELDGGALAAAATAGATTPLRSDRSGATASLSAPPWGGGSADVQRATGPSGISLHQAAIDSISVSPPS